MLVSAVQQSESAISIDTHPLFWASFPPHPHPTPPGHPRATDELYTTAYGDMLYGSFPEASYLHMVVYILGFPGGSDHKESVCSVGDLGSIPGSGRSPGEGNGNPLRYSCLSVLLSFMLELLEK